MNKFGFIGWGSNLGFFQKTVKNISVYYILLVIQYQKIPAGALNNQFRNMLASWALNMLFHFHFPY